LACPLGSSVLVKSRFWR